MLGRSTPLDTIIFLGSDNTSGTLFGMWLLSAVVPTGTSVTMSATCSVSPGGTPRYGVFSTDNSKLSNPTAPTHNYTTGTSSPISVSVSVASGAGAIGMFWDFAVTDVGWTAGFSSSDGTFGGSDWSHANNLTAGTFTATYSFTGTGHPDRGVAIFR